MIKNYVLDTNVLLSDPNSIFSFEENNVIIPIAVIEELDNQKNRQDAVGKNARYVSRSLDQLRDTGMLFHGVPTAGGGKIFISTLKDNFIDLLPYELKANNKVDNLIIATMLNYKKYAESENEYTLISNDVNVRIKCDALDIKCEEYKKSRLSDDPTKLYKGVRTIEVSSNLIDSFYHKRHIFLPECLVETELCPNEIIVLKAPKEHPDATQKSAMTRYTGEKSKNSYELVSLNEVINVFGLNAKNKEQTFCFDLLFNDKISLITMIGASGCGKTLLALAAALEQLKGLGSLQKYDKLIVTRPVQPVGKDIGFLPGTMEEKMSPWISPIKDNLSFLMNNKSKKRAKEKKQDGFDDYVSVMQENGLIEIEAITFIRGRSIPNAFIIIDEAQNLSAHEVKTIITRAGEGSKIVLIGDIEQIDNVHIDEFSNGLTYAVEKFKEYKLSGHITLLKGERSELATLAAKIL